MKLINKKTWLGLLFFAFFQLFFCSAVFATQIDHDSYGTIHENASSSNFLIYEQIADPAAGRTTSSNYILEHYFTLGTTTFNHCYNSILDYDEAQIDCGGSMCRSCTFHCSNGIMDYDETGTDCGGVYCSACSSGGGPGGGGVSPTASIVLQGKTAPDASVKILKDSVLMAIIVADASGNFSYIAGGLSSGDYRFSLYFDDKFSTRSASIDVQATVTTGQSITTDAVLLPVTIGTDKSQVKRGDDIQISGMTAPNATVFITVTSGDGQKNFIYPVTAGSDGRYFLRLGTGALNYSTYKVSAYATLGALKSKNSLITQFKVGEITEIIPPGKKCPLKGDVNFDCRVNLVDFSITAYWFSRKISPGFLVLEKERLSGDGNITLIDFSILAYYWTG